ncbi:hypothetical protein BJ322DRAFT_542655 [Thelephora terrestris]|uniref:Uncharacterized protein n=1 Tax=Thelephora terrestris TaxID=56493 RepID=A0A9P6HKS3_9AGAM|nr:hypothetical protein BJ322DRAFT_542655 [Thelephora terrestris]
MIWSTGNNGENALLRITRSQISRAIWFMAIPSPRKTWARGNISSLLMRRLTPELRMGSRVVDMRGLLAVYCVLLAHGIRRAWRNASFEATRSALGRQDRSWAIAWNLTKPLLTSCSADKTVRLYNYRAPPPSDVGSSSHGGEPKFELTASITTGHAKAVRALAWSVQKHSGYSFFSF